MTNTQRPRRTKEQWEALQAISAKQRPVPTQGAEGTVHVTIDGIPWQAPSVGALEYDHGLVVEVRYVRRWGWFKKGGWYSWNEAGKRARRPSERSIRMGPRHKGGKTFVRILDPQTMTYGEGIAYCTAQDVFDRRKGYVLAVNRALQNLHR
jgi:hypothetical protein